MCCAPSRVLFFDQSYGDCLPDRHSPATSPFHFSPNCPRKETWVPVPGKKSACQQLQIVWRAELQDHWRGHLFCSRCGGQVVSVLITIQEGIMSTPNMSDNNSLNTDQKQDTYGSTSVVQAEKIVSLPDLRKKESTLLYLKMPSIPSSSIVWNSVLQQAQLLCLRQKAFFPVVSLNRKHAVLFLLLWHKKKFGFAVFTRNVCVCVGVVVVLIIVNFSFCVLHSQVTLVGDYKPFKQLKAFVFSTEWFIQCWQI